MLTPARRGRSNIGILRTFTEEMLPDLDEVVLAVLDFFADVELPQIPKQHGERPLVVGSENAGRVGRLLFADRPAIFADESTYEAKLKVHTDIDVAYVVSASGGKHSTGIVRDLSKRGLEVFLITNNQGAPAGEALDPDHVIVFPKVREPYTYNVSTYLSMLLADSREDPVSLCRFIEKKVDPVLEKQNFASYDSFFLIVPPAFDALRGIFNTKFDELFGGRVSGRIFTQEQAKHAKTVVLSESECFISFGEENRVFGARSQRVQVPLPPRLGPAGMVAIAYYVIGYIQGAHPPYFKEHIKGYVEEASELFGEDISVIVE